MKNFTGEFYDIFLEKEKLEINEHYQSPMLYLSLKKVSNCSHGRLKFLWKQFWSNFLSSFGVQDGETFNFENFSIWFDDNFYSG